MIQLNGGRSSVGRALEFKSEDPGFHPLAGQGEGQVFYPCESVRVQTALCLTPLRVYRHGGLVVKASAS